MKDWPKNTRTYEEIVSEYGPWSAMSIRLSDGEYTRKQAVDFRLKRLVQVAADIVGKPLEECRVLDLACLEGHYGIEFALHGAEAVCVEVREANIAKAAYAVDKLGLTNCRLIQDDVRNLNKTDYGEFDIIVCSGILYHLEAGDVVEFLRSIGECCRGICLLDTYVAVSTRDSVEVAGQKYEGIFYTEHDESDDQDEKEEDLWASIDNVKSFWFTQSDLISILYSAGFTSTSEVCLPTMPGLTIDRRTYAAVKGVPVKIHSSEMTDAQPYLASGMPSGETHQAQIDHGFLFKVAKQHLPQNLKDIVKPPLRKMGILKTADYKDFRKEAD